MQIMSVFYNVNANPAVNSTTTQSVRRAAPLRHMSAVSPLIAAVIPLKQNLIRVSCAQLSQLRLLPLVSPPRDETRHGQERTVMNHGVSKPESIKP